MELLKSQGIEGLELDAEALKVREFLKIMSFCNECYQVLTQFAGKEFEETYKRIAEEKAKEGGDQKEKSENAESMEQEN